MSALTRFTFGWQPGASAQMEFFSPGSGTEIYRLKYTLPFRATLRPPLKELPISAETINDLNYRLERIAQASHPRRQTQPSLPKSSSPPILGDLVTFGEQLMDLIVADAADLRTELTRGNLLLDIGLDEPLLSTPWELLYDGEEFLCLKHAVGRYVNIARPAPLPVHSPEPFPENGLSILLISVPRPQPREHGKLTYRALPGVEAESLAICEMLTKIDGVKISTLTHTEATYDGVWNAIKKEPRFHIVHFGGHAYFRDDQPQNSSLVLFDRDMPTGPLQSFFGLKPPRLFVMNACETATSSGTGASWASQFNIFGLARAFLNTGAYLLGSRWEVGDKNAAIFAKAFYSNFMAGSCVGDAIRMARIECKDAAAEAGAIDDFSWASYIFYGDPRLKIERI